MDLTYDHWWLEEVKEHYKLFKYTVTIIFFMIVSQSTILILFSQAHSIEGVRTEYAIMFFFVLGTLIALLWYFGRNIKTISLIVAFLVSEWINVMFCILSHTTLKSHTTVLCIVSTVHIVLFQMGFIKSLKLALIIPLKHIFIWYTHRVISGDIPIHIPATFSAQIAITVYIMVSEYIKRKKNYEKFFIRKKLEYAQRNLQTILDSFPDGLIVFNNQLSIVYSNDKILEFLDCSKSNLLKVLQKVTYMDKRRDYLGQTDNNLLINDVDNSRNLKFGSESSLGLSSASNQILKWKLIKILWEDCDCILLNCSDITKTIEFEKLYTENNSKTSLIKSFSHELRTPISAILHYIDLSIQAKELPTVVYKYLKYALVSSKQLFSQINDIIDLSNILCNKFKIMKQNFNLREWVSEHLEIFKVIAEEKNLVFSIIVDNLLPAEIYTDPSRLKQVVYCFINNSLKFTFKGRIKILLKLTADFRLKFEFNDTGIGIQNERKTHLLNFFSGRSKLYDSGIGLYISKLILGYIGSGNVFLQSLVDHGTEFAFTVDIKSNQCSRRYSESCDPTIEENFDLNPVRIFETNALHRDNCDILIVDDIELNRKILISTLKDLRPSYLEAENGREAVEIVKRMNDQNKHIKVIIMDCNMPIMDGWEAARVIIGMEVTKIIKKSPRIIAYTTYSSEEDITLCYECGMSYCLIKPSTPSEIVKTVKYYLENH